MSSDSYTETSSSSWGSRITGALAGMVFSPIALLAGCGLLIWNEGNVVKRAQSLDEGEKQVITVPADQIDPAHAGKLVHVTGETSVTDKLTDKELGVSEPAVKLFRVVEMYQWTEHKDTKRKNNKTTTTYSYHRKWVEEPQNSRGFHKSGYDNPGSMPLRSHEVIAEQVALGEFQLDDLQIAQIKHRDPRDITAEEFAAMPENVRRDAEQRGGELYMPVGRWLPHAPQDELNKQFKPSAEAGNENAPQIGDVRVKYQVVKPGPTTVVGRQTGNGFDPFPTKAGKTIMEFRTATMSSHEMFEAARADNTLWAWILRAIGVGVLFAGFMLLTGPLTALADWIPGVNSLVSGGMFVVSLGGTLIVGSLVIAVAWLAYHPAFAIGFLAACVLLAAAVWYLFRRKRQPVLHESGLEIVS
jgi:hypothetical protein